MVVNRSPSQADTTNSTSKRKLSDHPEEMDSSEAPNKI
ncbi:unnamed protein product, partial [Allacma fusca]